MFRKNIEQRSRLSKETPALDRLREIFKAPEELEAMKVIMEGLCEEHDNEIKALEGRIIILESKLNDLGLKNSNLK